MAQSINKVTLLGNIGRDPELKVMSSGGKIVTLSVATSESWTDRTSGERQERTEWHRVVIMNDRLSELAEKYLHKGSRVYLEGKLQTRKWTDQAGQDRYTTEVMLGKFGGELVMLDRSEGGGERAPTSERAPARPRRPGNGHAPPQRGGWDELPEDPMPF